MGFPASIKNQAQEEVELIIEVSKPKDEVMDTAINESHMENKGNDRNVEWNLFAMGFLDSI